MSGLCTAFLGTVGAGLACTVFGGASFEDPSESAVRSVRLCGGAGGFLGFGGWFGNSFMYESELGSICDKMGGGGLGLSVDAGACGIGCVGCALCSGGSGGGGDGLAVSTDSSLWVKACRLYGFITGYSG